MKKSFFIALLALCLVSCEKGYHRTDRGVIVDINLNGNYKQADQTSRVMLEVMGEKLIHVKAIQGLDFPNDSSLIIVPNLPKVRFKVESTDDSVFVMTNAVVAGVERKTGNVRFLDAVTGEVILQEVADSRTFTPIEKGGERKYSVRQAFYGQDG